MAKRKFLVVYDYGTGGAWLYISARSPEEITAMYSELKVVDVVPWWMSDELRARIESTMSFDIDDEPVGFLKLLVDARNDR